MNPPQLSEGDQKWHAQMFQTAISTLDKPYSLREAKDIELLMRVTEHVGFFVGLAKDDPEAHVDCCHFLYHKFLKKGEMVFEQGSIGKTFYIIIQGSVGVVRTDLKQVVTLFHKGSTYKDKVVGDTNNDPHLYEEVKKEVRVMVTGESFGEVALRDKVPRQASVIAKEDTYLACLDKEHYDKILYKIDERKKAEDLKFYQGIPMLKHFSNSSLQKLHLNMIPVKIYRNQAVYVQGGDSGDVFFVKEGEIKLTKSIELTWKSLNTDEFPINDPAALKKKPTTSKKWQVDLALVSEGHIFGEDDYVLHRKRTTNAICVTSEALVLKINGKEFTRRVMHDDHASKYIMTQINSKNHLYAERVNKVQNTTNVNKNWLMQVQSLSNKVVTAEQQIREYITPRDFASPKESDNRNQFVTRNRYLTLNTEVEVGLDTSRMVPATTGGKTSRPTVETRRVQTPRNIQETKFWVTPKHVKKTEKSSTDFKNKRMSDHQIYEAEMHNIFKKHSHLVLKDGKVISKSRLMTSAQGQGRRDTETYKRAHMSRPVSGAMSSTESLTFFDSRSKSKSKSKSKSRSRSKEREEVFRPYGSLVSRIASPKVLKISETQEENWSSRVDTLQNVDTCMDSKRSQEQSKQYLKYVHVVVAPEISSSVGMNGTTNDPRLATPLGANDVRFTLINKFQKSSFGAKMRADSVVNDFQKHDETQRSAILRISRPQTGSYYIAGQRNQNFSKFMNHAGTPVGSQSAKIVNYNTLTSMDTFDTESSRLLFKDQVNRQLHLAIKEGKSQRPATSKTAGSSEFKPQSMFFKPSNKPKSMAKINSIVASPSSKKLSMVGAYF